MSVDKIGMPEVSRRRRVTFYINPNEPDGQQLVMLGPVNDENLEIASRNFGCKKERIKTLRGMVTDKYLNSLPEYDG